MNEKSITAIVSSDENVARLISSEWMQEGILQPVAFTLDENESYLSVNRPVVETYDTDVASFIMVHPLYGVDGLTYFRALLNVGDVRKIKAQVCETTLSAEVEVDFQGKDFGYARSLKELELALDEADAERNDPTKWITPVEFHTRLENKYPWLR